MAYPYIDDKDEKLQPLLAGARYDDVADGARGDRDAMAGGRASHVSAGAGAVAAAASGAGSSTQVWGPYSTVPVRLDKEANCCRTLLREAWRGTVTALRRLLKGLKVFMAAYVAFAAYCGDQYYPLEAFTPWWDTVPDATCTDRNKRIAGICGFTCGCLLILWVLVHNIMYSWKSLDNWLCRCCHRRWCKRTPDGAIDDGTDPSDSTRHAGAHEGLTHLREQPWFTTWRDLMKRHWKWRITPGNDLKRSSEEEPEHVVMDECFKVARQLGFWVLFTAVLIVSLFLIMVVFPDNPEPTEDDIGLFIHSWFGLKPLYNMTSESADGTISIDVVIGDEMLALGIWALLVCDLVVTFLIMAAVKWDSRFAAANNSESEADAEALTVENKRTDLQTNAGRIPRTAVFIACHDSVLGNTQAEANEKEQALWRSIYAAKQRFPARAIFVCDNSKQTTPLDWTANATTRGRYRPSGSTGKSGPDSGRRLCRTVTDLCKASGVNYVYLPIGNKSHAFYAAVSHWLSLYERSNHVTFDFVLLMDDDVVLGSDFHVPLKTLGDKEDIHAVCYTIRAGAASEAAKGEPDELTPESIAAAGDRAVNVSSWRSTLTAWQDIEYRLNDAARVLQCVLPGRYGSALCAHGAISLWRKDTLKQVLENHDGEFHGEDLFMGLELHKFDKGYRIMVDTRSTVTTYAPEQFIGGEGSLLRQRVASWDLCTQRQFLRYLLFAIDSCRCRMSTALLRLFCLYEFVNVCFDFLRPFLLATLMVLRPKVFGVITAFGFGSTYLQLAVLDIVALHNRPELRCSRSLIGLLTFPVYRLIGTLFRLFALLENMMVYAPGHPLGDVLRQRLTEDRIPPGPTEEHPSLMRDMRWHHVKDAFPFLFSPVIDDAPGNEVTLRTEVVHEA